MNNFDEKYFVELKNLNDNIIVLEQNKKEIKEKKLDEYKKDYYNIFQEITSKYQLFQKLKNIDDTIKKKREKAQNYLKWYIGGGFLSGMITFVPFANVPILFVIYFYLISRIESIFEIKPITFFEKIRIIFGFQTPLEIASSKLGAILDIGNGVSKAQWGYLKIEGFEKYYSEAGTLLGYIFDPSNPSNLKGEILTETFNQQIQTHKNNLRYWINLSNSFHDNYIKFVPIIGTLIGGLIDSYGVYKVGQNAIEFCEEKLKEDKSCYCILNRKQNINLLFDYIDELSKQNWNENIINEINFDDD